MSITLDWNKYQETARQAIAEGCVLLENNNQVLPLKKDSTVAIFGRIQNYYYKSGTGSGGKVNVTKVYNIVEGLEESGHVKIDTELQKIYADWEKENPYDEGLGWGKERWSQDEMPLTEKTVSDAAARSDTALVIIGRTAGEDKDNSATAGSYLLSDGELDMIKKVRAGFKKMAVLLNVGNIIDMNFVDECKPDAVMYVWQGGMLGGLGTADVLTGKINPSGKLTDTIATDISKYPSTPYFGDTKRNFYKEDIYVGYRYFSTFDENSVRYPFGYGLSYSNLETKVISALNDEKSQKISITVEVKNKSTDTTTAAAKEVVQIYVKAPCGKLGKAARVLVDFKKTDLLASTQSQKLTFEIPYENFASYDDTGATNHKSCFVLEEGEYEVFVGNSVKSAESALKFELSNLIIIKECEEALSPVLSFERMQANKNGELTFVQVPTSTVDIKARRLENLPKEIPQVTTSDYKLADVLSGKIKIEDFVAQFTDDDLSCIIRGEGMGSSLVTAGTASAFGGVSPRLRETFGIPAVCTDDGPSGMRLDCGIKAFALPNGTSLACTFNRDLVADLYAFTGMEMTTNNVENLLGPGMNIHRNPLNGRNFEYFSEDPFVTGEIGAAVLRGLHKYNTTGTIKHFVGNEQETNRFYIDSVISERALREIYLKGFEIAVKSGYADSIMTTYGMVNGIYTASNYDLNTTILRKEWGFTGIVMTDWWAQINEPGVEPSRNNFAAMIRSQNDLYMCCPDGSKNASDDNTLKELNEGKLTRAELQRSAISVCNHVMNTNAMKRLMKTLEPIEIINRPVCADDVKLEDVAFIKIEEGTVIDLSDEECKANANIILALDVESPGTYEITLTGASDLSELAQLPCTFLYQGIPIQSFTFNGTGGKYVSLTKKTKLINRFCVCRLFIAANGLKLKDMKFHKINNDCSFNFD